MKTTTFKPKDEHTDDLCKKEKKRQIARRKKLLIEIAQFNVDFPA